jgi:hypothetical protein
MTKCPFCAEDVQDEAKKCKHCGEWLTDLQHESLICNGPDAAPKEINKNEINSDINITADESVKPSEGETSDFLADEDASKYRDIPGAVNLNPVRKPGKYGWGWLIFLVWFANGHKVISFYNSNILSVELLLIFPLMVVYFNIRRKFLNKMAYNQKKWLAGLTAGVFT